VCTRHIQSQDMFCIDVLCFVFLGMGFLATIRHVRLSRAELTAESDVLASLVRDFIRRTEIASAFSHHRPVEQSYNRTCLRMTSLAFPPSLSYLYIFLYMRSSSNRPLDLPLYSYHQGHTHFRTRTPSPSSHPSLLHPHCSPTPSAARQ
jgi:hypothetical protein